MRSLNSCIWVPVLYVLRPMRNTGDIKMDKMWVAGEACPGEIISGHVWKDQPGRFRQVRKQEMEFQAEEQHGQRPRVMKGPDLFEKIWEALLCWSLGSRWGQVRGKSGGRWGQMRWGQGWTAGAFPVDYFGDRQHFPPCVLWTPGLSRSS